ncbi:twin-arginine translocase subunit TatC [Alkaliphilus serpentinus]|uniref:Sec-independent protein translocase protein TatC n=1 Tax=Alkaliphilus serpentinus TaxID=1482731 RepID=A0A833HPX7_9FIRM|nr:twin-arginine translocase subunit TatC [Alkaliphilus serpentinus]KAB3530244.1 twin-arginine translocase subunit TatC [Alkaliphilus serpentinus]
MEDKKLSLVGHLEELRKRIIIIAIALIMGGVISYFYVDKIVDYIIMPAKELKFIYLSPPDLFLAYIKISLLTGLIITLPIVLYQIWRFVLPGLDLKQRLYLVLANILAMVFFLLGAAFAYFGIVPLTIEFFIKMSRDDIEPLFSFANYISFVGSMLLSFGLTFQLPILVMMLSQFNIVNPTFLRKSRKFIILIIFIVAAILTPPDIVSQILLATPMVLLFELSIIISSFIYKRKNK